MIQQLFNYFGLFNILTRVITKLFVYLNSKIGIIQKIFNFINKLNVFLANLSNKYLVLENYVSSIVSIPVTYTLNNLLETNIITEFVIVFNVTYYLYFILEYYLNKYNYEFKNINPEHKKMYVVKNFLKSLYLAVICINIPYVIHILNNNFDIYFIKRCTIYYVINDIIGLYLVKKLPTTTKIHHATSTFFSFLTLLKSDNQLDIITLIVLYAIFSSLAFCVNFYLGFRVFSNNNIIKYYLSLSSFWIYLITCLCNWSLQIYFMYKLFYISVYQLGIFIVFLYLVGKDDIILMKWLKNDAKLLIWH